MDSEEDNIIPFRRTHRLTLDSQQQQRRQQQRRRQEQQYQRQRQEKRRRKEQKKRQRQQRQRQYQELAKKEREERMKQIERYNDPAKLFQKDSNSSINFKRIGRKIKVMYPQFNRKSRKYSQSQSQSQDSQEDQSSEESESSLKQKKTKKISKRRQDDSHHQKKPKQKVAVKVQQQLTRKQALVLQVAKRWWYAIPQWPPIDHKYEEQLKKQGYRIVKSSQFRLADQIKDGLTKTTQLEGYPGIFRSKHKIIDVRPKQMIPSINYFSSLSEQELRKLLKNALYAQIQELKAVEFLQNGEQELIKDLQKQINNLQ